MTKLKLSNETPGLLVSVRSAAEALSALAGGADVIDVKEPNRGSLGAADDETISSAELDRVGAMQDRISDLEAANQKLTLERNTAVIEARRLQRDLSATQGALAYAERRDASS